MNPEEPLLEHKKKKALRHSTRLAYHVHTWVEKAKGGTVANTRIKVAVYCYNRRQRKVTYGASVYCEENEPTDGANLSKMQQMAMNRLELNPVTLVLLKNTQKDYTIKKQDYAFSIQDVNGIIEQMVTIAGCDGSKVRDPNGLPVIHFTYLMKRKENKRPKVLETEAVSIKTLARHKDSRSGIDKGRVVYAEKLKDHTAKVAALEKELLDAKHRLKNLTETGLWAFLKESSSSSSSSSQPDA